MIVELHCSLYGTLILPCLQCKLKYSKDDLTVKRNENNLRNICTFMES